MRFKKCKIKRFRGVNRCVLYARDQSVEPLKLKVGTDFAFDLGIANRDADPRHCPVEGT